MEKKTHDIEGLVKGGPYSHVVEAGGFLFVSGQVPIESKEKLMIMDDVAKATAVVLENVKKALEAVGSSLDRVVKTTVFLRDMADFNTMNETYQRYFPEYAPARSCVAVKGVPGNLPLEIEVIALK
jgi:2-iminobutanoate/2-iminopropanoate deaminase